METVTSWILNNYIEIFGAVAGIIYVFLEIRQNIWLWPVGIVTSAVYIYVFFTGKLYADMSLQGYYLVISVAGWYWWGVKRNGSEEEKGKRRRGEGEKRRERGSELRAQSSGHRAQGSELRAQVSSEASSTSEVLTEGRRDEETERRRDEGTERRRDGETKRRRDVGTEGMKVTRLELRIGIVLAIVFTGLLLLMWFVLDRFTDSPVPLWDSFITSLSIVATWMLARKIYEHWFLWIIVNAAAALLFFTRELYPTVILYCIYLIMSFAGLKEWRKSLVKGTSI